MHLSLCFSKILQILWAGKYSHDPYLLLLWSSLSIFFLLFLSETALTKKRENNQEMAVWRAPLLAGISFWDNCGRATALDMGPFLFLLDKALVWGKTFLLPLGSKSLLIWNVQYFLSLLVLAQYPGQRTNQGGSINGSSGSWSSLDYTRGSEACSSCQEEKHCCYLKIIIIIILLLLLWFFEFQK